LVWLFFFFLAFAVVLVPAHLLIGRSVYLMMADYLYPIFLEKVENTLSNKTSMSLEPLAGGDCSPEHYRFRFEVAIKF